MFFRERVSNWLDKISRSLEIDLAYVLKGGSFLTLGNFAAVFSNFILAFFFARLLPKEVYGTYSYILAWISVLGIFALPGMDRAIIQSVSKGFESSLILGLKKKIQYGVLGTLAALILGAYYSYNGNQILAWAFFVGAVFIPFVNSFKLYNAFLLGKKEFKTQTLYLILNSKHRLSGRYLFAREFNSEFNIFFKNQAHCQINRPERLGNNKLCQTLESNKCRLHYFGLS
jgi:hypothetical protein